MLKVKVKWLLDVKIKGNSPQKLFNIIKINKDTGIKVRPGAALGPVIALNSLCRYWVTLVMVALMQVEHNQKLQGRKEITNTLLSQFTLNPSIATGSNTENKLDI